MNEQMLICPHCKKEFPITDALAHELREKLEVEIKGKLETESASLVADLKRQLANEKEERKKAQDTELNLRKEREALQDEREQWELKKQRELDAERDNIRQKAIARIQEEQQVQERLKDEYIKSLEEKIADLNQKVEQGSQQAQGEALELVLEDFLKQKFPFDEIIRVQKGVHGADILQKVYSEQRHYCGTIIWESKNTKNWGNEWCEKLKEDQRAVEANIAVLVSRVLPKEVVDFAHFNGVWVTAQTYVYGVATALRMSLIEISAVRRASEDKGGKAEDLFDYLVSPNFSQRIKAIVDYFTEMQKDLESEKRAVQRLWKKRETQIERVTQKTAEIYGALEAIIGRPIAQIDGFELQLLTAGIEAEIMEAVD